MNERPVLCIDTAYDQHTRTIQEARKPLYHELKDQLPLVQFGPTLSNRIKIRKALGEGYAVGRPFGTVLVTSHGAPSQVYGSPPPDRLLLDAGFPEEELRLWAQDRVLYFMCCETGLGGLLSLLKSLGARLVIGYEGKPQAQSEAGWRRWIELDREIVRNLLAKPAVQHVEAIRDAWLGRLDGWIPEHAGDLTYVRDLRDMRGTLQTMSIL